MLIAKSLVAGAAAVAAVATAAFAAGGALVDIQPTFARAEIPAPHVSVADTCQGVDGTYTLLHVTGTGTITSADPRLSGTFMADAYILDNPVTGLGVSTDEFKVLDPVTGQLKWKGTAWAIDKANSVIKSLALGELRDGTRFAALATVWLPKPGSSDPLVIEYGGAGSGDDADRAILVSGDCDKMLKNFAFR